MFLVISSYTRKLQLHAAVKQLRQMGWFKKGVE